MIAGTYWIGDGRFTCTTCNREANGCADALAKWGTRQHTSMAVYSDCPTFAHVIYVRDGYGLGDFQLCAPGPDVGVV